MSYQALAFIDSSTVSTLALQTLARAREARAMTLTYHVYVRMAKIASRLAIQETNTMRDSVVPEEQKE